MSNNPTTPIEPAAKIMARLILATPERDRDLSAVFDALLWLKQNCPDKVWIVAEVRDMMEALNV